MQINYVIVALAVRHVQQRMKKGNDATDSWLERGVKGTRADLLRYSDLFNYDAAELHWKHNFWVLASPIHTRIHSPTPLTWPASDKLLLLSKHACQVAMKQSLMSTLLYLP